MAIDKLQTDALSNTVTANIASVAIGANVSINSSTFVVGSGQIKATGITLPSNFGVSRNTTNLLENRNGQLFFNGRRVDLVNEYVAVYGYALGGSTGAYVATADRITFSTSATAASTVSNLSQARGYIGGISDITIYGYALGGGTGAIVATADRTTFSTSVTAASTVSNISQARYYLTGISDGAIYGYALGGTTGAYVSTADRLTFSTSATVASTVSNLSSARPGATGISDGAIYGYALGGATGSAVSVTTADRIVFSTSATAASTVSNLSLARDTSAGVSDGAIYGYVMGGFASAGSPNITAVSDRTTFSTGATAASTASNLSQARYTQAGASDGAVYGYAMGGNTPGASVSTTDRITFSSSITAASTTSNLSQARVFATAFSDGAV